MSDTKPWYNTLQLPPLVTTSLSKKNNKISPLIPSAKSESLDTTSPTFSHILKRLSPRNTISKRPVAPQHEFITQHIYMKSPHAVASGELAGSIVIEDGDTSFMQLEFSRLELSLIGVEAVLNPHKTHAKTFEFLNLPILCVSTLEQFTTTATSKIMLPFSVSLPSELGGTYIDKKGSIQYYLCSTLYKQSSKPIHSKRQVIVFSNMVLKSLKDASTLYTPVLHSNQQLWKKADNSHIAIDLTMPRTVWISGAPIYVTVKIHNATLKDTIVDLKLELLRKQNTYSMNPQDQSIIPITSSCESISQSSLAALGWWKPLEPNLKDHATLAIEAPSNQVTVRNQKLIDVSFYIRMSISSAKNISEIVTELPVMLVHPISMDPPPGNYTKYTPTHKPGADECHVLQDNFQKQQQAAKILEPSTSFQSLGSACIRSHSSSIRSSATNNQLPSTARRFQSVRKSLSTWGSRITRKMSVSSGIDQYHQQRHQRQKLDISSPIMISSPSSSSLSDSIDSVVSLSKDQEDISNFIANKGMIDNTAERMSVLKFGQIKGPKRFGQQPGCLGDAGLDIRNCFNVATATEAMQSYAAEKVEISADDEWLMARHEAQCNVKSFKPDQSFETIEGRTMDTLVNSSFKKTNPKTENNGCISTSTLDTCNYPDVLEMSSSNTSTHHQSKRMLASSRHLRNVQRKSVQVSKDGHTLLALSNLSPA